MQEDRYEHINNKYPLIEGYLFKKLDNFILVSELIGNINIRYDGYGWYLGTKIVEIAFKRISTKIDIILFESQKRIGINISSSVNSFVFNTKSAKIKSLIKKELNIFQAESKNKTNNADYEFKYNYRNCQRIVDILEMLVANESKIS